MLLLLLVFHATPHEYGPPLVKLSKSLHKKIKRWKTKRKRFSGDCQWASGELVQGQPNISCRTDGNYWSCDCLEIDETKRTNQIRLRMLADFEWNAKSRKKKEKRNQWIENVWLILLLFSYANRECVCMCVCVWVNGMTAADGAETNNNNFEKWTFCTSHRISSSK